MSTINKYAWIILLGVMLVFGCPPQQSIQTSDDDKPSPSTRPAPTSYQQDLLKQIEDLKTEKKIAEDRLEDIRNRDNRLTTEYNKLKLTVQQQEQQIKLIGEALTERDALKERILSMQQEMVQLSNENKRLRDVISGLSPASAPTSGK